MKIDTTSGFDGPESPALPDLLRCVHCGLCLNHCPTYTELGLETESPRGRLYMMRGVTQGRVPITANLVSHLDNCLQCRNCEAVCPSGVRYGHIMEGARAEILRDGHAPVAWRASRLLLRNFFSQPQRLRPFMTVLGLYQRFGLNALAQALPGPMQSLAQMVPLVSARPYDARGLVAAPVAGAPTLRVALLAGCVMPYLFANVHRATVRVLARQGCRVTVPEGQVCCGALHLHAGDRQEARRLARRNIDAFLAEDIDAIVIDSGGCGAALKEYGELLKHDPRYAEKARRFSSMVREVTELLAERPLAGGLGSLPMAVTYQDPCHVAHAQGIKAQPRALLRAIPGLELREMAQPDLCCGSAGLYSVFHRDMSRRLLRRKMLDVASTGASVIATANPGCHLQLEAGLRLHGLPGRVVHVVELLDEAYRAGRPAHQ